MRSEQENFVTFLSSSSKRRAEEGSSPIRKKKNDSESCWIECVRKSLGNARIASTRSGRLKYGTGLCALCSESTDGDGTSLKQLLCVVHAAYARDVAESALTDVEDYLKPCHDLETKRQSEWQIKLEHLKATTQMTFGKYKSMYVADIYKQKDTKYLVWIAGWRYNSFDYFRRPIEHNGKRCPEPHREYARIILSNVCLFCFVGDKSTRSSQALCNACYAIEGSFAEGNR
jgi:hypothetical protein